MFHLRLPKMMPNTPSAPPKPAFGDTLSGSMLCGAICAALRRKRHGDPDGAIFRRDRLGEMARNIGIADGGKAGSVRQFGEALGQDARASTSLMPCRGGQERRPRLARSDRVFDLRRHRNPVAGSEFGIELVASLRTYTATSQPSSRWAPRRRGWCRLFDRDDRARDLS